MCHDYQRAPTAHKAAQGVQAEAKIPKWAAFLVNNSCPKLRRPDEFAFFCSHLSSSPDISQHEKMTKKKECSFAIAHIVDSTLFFPGLSWPGRSIAGSLGSISKAKNEYNGYIIMTVLVSYACRLWRRKSALLGKNAKKKLLQEALLLFMQMSFEALQNGWPGI